MENQHYKLKQNGYSMQMNHDMNSKSNVPGIIIPHFTSLPSPLASPVSTPNNRVTTLTPLPSPGSSNLPTLQPISPAQVNSQQQYSYNISSITPLGSPKLSQSNLTYSLSGNSAYDYQLQQIAIAQGLKTVVKKSTSLESQVGKSRMSHAGRRAKAVSSYMALERSPRIITTTSTMTSSSVANFDSPPAAIKTSSQVFMPALACSKSQNSKDQYIINKDSISNNNDAEMEDKSDEDEVFGAYMLEHLIPQCKQCGVRETPQWRRGWADTWLHQPVLLCNACGLKFAKKLFCPFCCCIYRREDDRFMVNMWISCSACSRPVHTDCERKKSHHPVIDSWLAAPHDYRCPDCRPKEYNFN